MKPSTRDVLRLLREQGEAGLTPLQALDEIGRFRLGARVWELKSEGYDVETRWEALHGKRYARYVLHEEPVQMVVGL